MKGFSDYNMKYHITTYEKDKLFRVSKKFYPYEVCGILGVQRFLDKNCLKVLFLENRALNPKRNFRLVNNDIERGKGILHENHYRFCGYFHSHPSTRALPTRSDKNYNIGNSLWLIQSVSYGELNLFTWNGKVFSDCELNILNNI